MKKEYQHIYNFRMYSRAWFDKVRAAAKKKKMTFKDYICMAINKEMKRGK